MGIVIDTYDNIFIAENCNHSIRKITLDQEVATFAGGNRGVLDGLGTQAKFDFPNSLSIDLNNNLYLAGNESHSIRKIDPSGYVLQLLEFTMFLEQIMEMEMNLYLKIHMAYLQNLAELFMSQIQETIL